MSQVVVTIDGISKLINGIGPWSITAVIFIYFVTPGPGLSIQTSEAVTHTATALRLPTIALNTFSFASDQREWDSCMGTVPWPSSCDMSGMPGLPACV